jgi:hypothetical protein
VRKSVTHVAGLNCYPCCRLIRTKPVFTQGVESESEVILNF